jgi:hypothetical protein
MSSDNSRAAEETDDTSLISVWDGNRFVLCSSATFQNGGISTPSSSHGLRPTDGTQSRQHGPPMPLSTVSQPLYSQTAVSQHASASLYLVDQNAHTVMQRWAPSQFKSLGNEMGPWEGQTHYAPIGSYGAPTAGSDRSGHVVSERPPMLSYVQPLPARLQSAVQAPLANISMPSSNSWDRRGQDFIDTGGICPVEGCQKRNKYIKQWLNHMRSQHPNVRLTSQQLSASGPSFRQCQEQHCFFYAFSDVSLSTHTRKKHPVASTRPAT